MLQLYAVTDRAWVGKQTLLEQIEDALIGGATLIQLREKNMQEEEFYREAVKVCKLCHRYNVALIINDNVDVAIRSGADGVHVGIEDTPVGEIRRRVGEEFIIGATCKSVEQARKAQEEGADYMGVGAVFASQTKSGAIRITSDQLREIATSVSIPAVAIGGITGDNVHLLTGCYVSGVAVVKAVFGAEDIRRATEELKEKVAVMLRSKTARTALTIAGSDSSGGAGIQADIKTMTMNGVYAMSAITALTAQNTTGVRAIEEVSCEFLKQQIDAVFEDIYPDSVKIGMVSSSGLIHVIAERLRFYGAKNVVVDPVMVATSGSALIKSDALNALTDELLGLATLVTPNIYEAQVLSGLTIATKEDMVSAAVRINELYGASVLLKGGHSVNDANDLLYDGKTCTWFEGERIDNPNTHGTGCTLSSAIAANLAKNYSLTESVRRAKEYISGALGAMLNLGRGSGPMLHNYDLNSRFGE
ncbi:MAG: bifunctional hydroxymethylpyrimidine kinase/phosphomethylpyrimidine kinase [Lachnospiraceae bacterium]|nr:bifunctional hydroxymethylpyrimidine kinase/phosphomethylpyrimidine kinase [Lachnospiraceae bacterium]